MRLPIPRIALAALVPTLVAASPPPPSPAPYAGLEERPIKALSSEQIAGYLAGEGMSLALAAELNGYPGPRHVLELAAELGLSAEQERRTRQIFAAMQAAAIELGRRIVDGERELDRLFAGRTITAREMTERSEELGRLRGRLRAVHLAAHLEQVGVLDASQVRRYVELRGYAGHPGHGAGHPGHGGGHPGHGGGHPGPRLR